jgi:hypothetical protein
MQAAEKDSCPSLRLVALLPLAYGLWLIAYGSLVSSICYMP